MYNSTPDPNRSRPTDSWIEISSRPSNSSLSSAAEDMVPTHTSSPQAATLLARRRRRLAANSTLPLDSESDLRHTAANGGNSSQEEYEESESESDHVMTSSNEAIGDRHMSGSQKGTEGDEDEDEDDYSDDEDEVATALGVHTDPQCFTPQPNAFTHPPSSLRNHDSAPNSYFPSTTRPSASQQRHSYSGNHGQTRNRSHSPYNVISPNHQAHHDAALRASLTTLLSCAAAARGLSKKQSPHNDSTESRGPSGRVEATTLRLVPESVALGPTSQQEAERARRRSVSTPASTSPSNSNRDPSPLPGLRNQSQQQNQQQMQSLEKNKRKAATGSGVNRSNSKDRRAVKKARRLTPSASPSSITDVSPTLLTWVVSAGVLVLVSALSFSAGYATGREAGRLEAGSIGGAREFGGTASGCARESSTGMGRGLRRLRWGSAATSVRA